MRHAHFPNSLELPQLQRKESERGEGSGGSLLAAIEPSPITELSSATLGRGEEEGEGEGEEGEGGGGGGGGEREREMMMMMMMKHQIMQRNQAGSEFSAVL